MEALILQKIEKTKNLESMVGVINFLCEVVEVHTSKKINKTDEKRKLALDFYKLVLAKLYANKKISAELYDTCKSIEDKDLEKYIDDVVEIWNRSRPLLQRLRKMCCK